VVCIHLMLLRACEFFFQVLTTMSRHRDASNFCYRIKCFTERLSIQGYELEVGHYDMRSTVLLEKCQLAGIKDVGESFLPSMIRA
jgi:hypothetical protein